MNVQRPDTDIFATGTHRYAIMLGEIKLLCFMPERWSICTSVYVGNILIVFYPLLMPDDIFKSQVNGPGFKQL